MNYSIPRILISSPKSGGGKTLIASALGKALVDKGYAVSMFKCGPDYVDPKLHKEITGNMGSNLDLFFNDEELLKERFCKKSADTFSIIEGAMGFYDGMGGNTEINSAFCISQCISSPVALVVDSEGSSFSLCALIKGFLSFRENNIKAVILNKCSASLFSVLKDTIEDECKITVLGFIPKDEKLKVRNQKLGLSLDKKDELDGVLCYLEELINKNIDLDKLISIMKNAPQLSISQKNNTAENLSLNVSVAKDEAFSFCYEDNIRFLEDNGCNISFFSPLYDNEIPPDTDLCIFGGGYIEKMAKMLSENHNMLSSVKTFWENGGAIIAEGSGFIYINDFMKDKNGNKLHFCKILDGRCKEEDRLVNFGYINLFDNGENLVLKGHEFHYSSCTDDGNSFTARRFRGQRSRKTVFYNERMFCGFPQFDFISNKDFFLRFLKNIKKK